MANNKALIVDDDSSFTESFTRLLETKGFDVTSFKSGAEAIECFCTSDFEIVFVDCLMPGEDGFSILKELNTLNEKKISPSQLHMISGIIDESAFKESLTNLNGISSFLQKPLELNKLEATLQSLSQKALADPVFLGVSEVETYILDQSKKRTYPSFFAPFFLLQLAQNEFSGELALTSTEDIWVLKYFKGKIFQVLSQDFTHSLGETLVSLGFLLEEDLKAYLKSPTEGLRIGQALIQQNVISPHSIDVALSVQMEKRIQSLLQTANFSVELKKSFNQKEPKLFLSNYDLIEICQKHIKTYDNPDWIQSILNIFNNNSFTQGPLIEMVRNQDFFSSLDKNILEKVEEAPSPYSKEEAVKLFILLCCKAILPSDKTIESTTANAFTELKERVAQTIQSLNFEDPYKFFKIDAEDTTDSEIATEYHKVAKLLHPDKLKALKISGEDLIQAEAAFTKATDLFNLIKTQEKRVSYKAYVANQSAQNLIHLNNDFEQAKKLLLSNKFKSAYQLLNNPKASTDKIEDYHLYCIWSLLKIDEPYDESFVEKHIKAEETESNKALVYFLRALHAHRQMNLESFQKNISLSLKAQADFLPARRELMSVKSQQMNTPSKKSNFLENLFKKSS